MGYTNKGDIRREDYDSVEAVARLASASDPEAGPLLVERGKRSCTQRT